MVYLFAPLPARVRLAERHQSFLTATTCISIFRPQMSRQGHGVAAFRESAWRKEEAGTWDLGADVWRSVTNTRPGPVNTRSHSVIETHRREQWQKCCTSQTAFTAALPLSGLEHRQSGGSNFTYLIKLSNSLKTTLCNKFTLNNSFKIFFVLHCLIIGRMACLLLALHGGYRTM